MTKETKIGLLVGLAFIIVTLLLLSDHLTSSNEPPLAPLNNTAMSVRDSIAAPVTDAPPIAVVMGSVTPRQPVSNDATVLPRSSQAIVRVGPADGTSTPIEFRQSITPPAPIAAETTATHPGSSVNVSQAPEPSGTLADFAKNHGQEVVSVGNTGEASSDHPQSVTQANTGSAFRKYVAQPGDTLSKLAGRFLGANNKTNRDLIVKANPSLAADPNKIIVGRSYNIPATGSARNAVPASATPTPTGTQTASIQSDSSSSAVPMNLTPAQPTGTVANASSASVDSAVWYTVKDNDSLWSIAQEQLGSGASWTAIKELNSDVLKGSDIVHPNMKLRLPEKPVASAQ